MPLLALAIAAATAAAVPGGDTIVVTAVPLSRLKSDLDSCIAARCPAKQDIDLSIRYAEGLFRTGKLVDAKHLLQATAGRTKGADAAEPVARSELFQATATVAQHEGDQRIFRDATFARAAVLRDNLSPAAPETLTAELGVGDLRARFGDPFRAADSYAATADKARAAGYPRIEMAARLRQAMLYHSRKRDGEARAVLDAVAADPRPGLQAYRLGARILTARIARDRGDTRATDELLAALAREPRGPAPMLLWSPPLPHAADTGDAFRDRTGGLAVDTSIRSSDMLDLGWADIGYWVRPDGRVEEAEVLRGNRKPGWAVPALAWVNALRFRPGGDGAGQYRVERFTLTADYAVPVGSLIRRRILHPRYEHLDITGGAPPATI